MSAIVRFRSNGKGRRVGTRYCAHTHERALWGCKTSYNRVRCCGLPMRLLIPTALRDAAVDATSIAAQIKNILNMLHNSIHGHTRNTSKCATV